jgi:hypothetical protein
MLKKSLPQKAPLYPDTPNQNIPRPTTLKTRMRGQHPHNELVPSTTPATPVTRTP